MTSADDRTSLLPAGTLISGRWEVLGRLGRGGMSTVYRVRDRELDEVVALKMLDRRQVAEATAVAMFKQEIRLARKIVHRNVCRIFDLGTDGDRLFVTMELVEGRPLTDVVRGKFPLDLDTRLEVFRDVLLGLRSAHAIGIVHRDLKPSNVLLATGGRTILMDFGIALPPEGKDLVGAGQVVGTPAYLAPERIRGGAGDARSDLYSLGVMLYELVCGKVPFDGTTVTELMTKHLRDLPDPPSKHLPEIPPDLEGVILRLLEKNPELRFASLDDLLETMAGIRAEARPPVVVLALPERALRKLVHLRLAAESIAVVPASTGEEAIEQVLRWHPDVAILDLQMPVVDGLDVVRYLKSRPAAAKVPLFLLSGSRDPQYDRFARSLGVESVHRKPVTVRELVRETVGRVAPVPPAIPPPSGAAFGEFH